MATQSGFSWGVFQPSPVPDVATAETVAFMCGCIDRSAASPMVQEIAQDAVRRFREPGCAGANADLARAVYWYSKYAVRVLPHSQFKTLVAAYPDKKQLLVSPDALLASPGPVGDCSAFTMLVCALLKCLGVPYELVTVAVDPRDPEIFTHVYPRAVLENAARFPLDASHGKYPGWEVPMAHVFRREVWAAAGYPILDSASRFTGLHEYVRRGLGDDTADLQLQDIDVTYDPTTGTYGDTGSSLSLSQLATLTEANQIAPSLSTTPYTSFPAGSMVAPTQNSTNWAAFATALAKSGMTLAEINAIQPGTVVGANGQILRQATAVGSGVTAALGSSSSVLLLAGAAVLVVVLLMGRKS